MDRWVAVVLDEPLEPSHELPVVPVTSGATPPTMHPVILDERPPAAPTSSVGAGFGGVETRHTCDGCWVES